MRRLTMNIAIDVPDTMSEDHVKSFARRALVEARGMSAAVCERMPELSWTLYASDYRALDGERMTSPLVRTQHPWGEPEDDRNLGSLPGRNEYPRRQGG